MGLYLVVGGQDLTDEADGLTWSSVDPGGHEALSFTLPTDSQPPDIGDRARLYEGMECIWDGRVEESGPDYAARRATSRVSCVGAGATLKDTRYSMIYVDRDLGRWAPPSLAWRSANITNNYGQVDGSVTPDTTTGLPSLILGFQGAWASPAKPAASAQYDAGPGNLIAAIYAKWTLGTGVTTSTPWAHRLYVGADDSPTALTAEIDNTAAAALSGGGYDTFAAAKRFLTLEFRYDTTGAGTQGTRYEIRLQNLAVYGPHDLTRRGSDPGGFYTSDIARHALAQAVGIDPGPIEQDTTVIALQAAYPDPTTPEQVIDDMAKLVGFHWGVWAAPDGQSAARLHFVSPPTSATAYVSREEAEQFSPAARLSDLHDTIYVRYRDAAGSLGQVTVTRPNPRLPYDLAGRSTTVDMGEGSETAATTYGTMLLALEEQQARAAGPLTLPGDVSLPGGGHMPAHLLRAGLDRLRITDLPNAGPWTESDSRRFDTFRIRRVESRADRGGKITTTIEVDAGADLTEVLNAELANQLAAIG